MKLYATTTSERASKGQGGNDFLKVDIFTGSEKESIHRACIKLDVVDDEAVMQVWDIKKGELCERQIYKLKGKQQKSKLCETCRTGHNGQKCTTKDCICTLCNIDKR